MLFDKTLRIPTTYMNSTSSETEIFAFNNKISVLFMVGNKLYSPLQHSYNLTGKCHAIGDYSYTKRLPLICK